MKDLLFILVIFFQFTQVSLCQSWTYKKGGNPFDGEYRTSLVVGTSDDQTYRNPMFVVNHFDETAQFNIYIGNIGFFCDNVSVKVMFKGDETVYHAILSAQNKKETVFLDRFYYLEDRNVRVFLTKFDFLDLVKQGSIMYVRVEDNCDIMNLEFSLSGSSKAINFVYGDLKEKIEKQMKLFHERKLELSNIEPGPALIFLKPNFKYVSIYETDNYRGKEPIARIRKTDTIEVVTISEDHVKIKTKDGITGWCNVSFIQPL